MSTYKTVQHTGSLGAVVADGCSILSSLAEEIREIVDNASEGLAQTQRIQTLSETADTLEGMDLEPDVPEALADEPVEYGEFVSTRKRRGVSRATQRDNAVQMLQAVVDLLGEEEYNEDGDAEELADALQAIIDEAEGCEFPGMFG